MTTKAKLIAAGLLIVPAWVLVPVEHQIQSERVRMKYGGPNVTVSVRDQITQGAAIALLAGFRGVVADFVWTQNHGFWEQKEWLRMYRNMELATTLQPQSVQFWDSGQWHMAWNIGLAAKLDPVNHTLAAGLKREREWHERAREFLERGIENVPNRFDLYFSLGWLYEQKFVPDCRSDPGCEVEQYCKAAEWMGRAAAFPDAPSHVGRIYARMVEKCGDVVRAYELWKAMWRAYPKPPTQLWNVVERETRRLEDQLNIADDQRVFPKHAAAPAAHS